MAHGRKSPGLRLVPGIPVEAFVRTCDARGCNIFSSRCSSRSPGRSASAERPGRLPHPGPSQSRCLGQALTSPHQNRSAQLVFRRRQKRTPPPPSTGFRRRRRASPAQITLNSTVDEMQPILSRILIRLSGRRPKSGRYQNDRRSEDSRKPPPPHATPPVWPQRRGQWNAVMRWRQAVHTRHF